MNCNFASRLSRVSLPLASVKGDISIPGSASDFTSESCRWILTFGHTPALLQSGKSVFSRRTYS